MKQRHRRGLDGERLVDLPIVRNAEAHCLPRSSLTGRTIDLQTASPGSTSGASTYGSHPALLLYDGFSKN